MRKPLTLHEVLWTVKVGHNKFAVILMIWCMTSYSDHDFLINNLSQGSVQWLMTATKKKKEKIEIINNFKKSGKQKHCIKDLYFSVTAKMTNINFNHKLEGSWMCAKHQLLEVWARGQLLVLLRCLKEGRYYENRW